MKSFLRIEDRILTASEKKVAKVFIERKKTDQKKII